jgi:two-component system OmpR family sensor kinase
MDNHKTEKHVGSIGNKLLVGATLLVFGSIFLGVFLYKYTGVGDTLFTMIPLIILAFVITLIAFDVLVNSIISPLKLIRDATLKVEKGDFSTRVNIKTNDELKELGDSFNKMTEEIGKIDAEYKKIDNAKTSLLSISSHELRSPMTPMKAQLEMLKDQYFGKLNAQQLESVEMVLRNTNRLDNIIVDFLEVSRIEAARLKFRYEKSDLKENIKALVKELESYLPQKHIKINAEISKIPVFEVDPDRVMQVLRNLLTNAEKFSPDKSQIDVKAELKGKFVEFSVKDSGIGIAAENQARIFEPFFQEEQTMYRKYGGVGLGLAICKGIVESQGGKIWFDSVKDKGTTFHFTFPLTPPKEQVKINMAFTTPRKLI